MRVATPTQVDDDVDVEAPDVASIANPFRDTEAWRVPRAAAAQVDHDVDGDVQTAGAPWTPESLAVELQARGLRVDQKSNGYWAQCPCPEHDDRDPSLHFHAGVQVPLVVKCRSRCSQADVLKAIGPAPSWTAQPYALQLSDDPAEWMCPAHRDVGVGLVSGMPKLPPAERAIFIRACVHVPQRQRIRRVRLARPHARNACLVLLGAVPAEPSAHEEAVIELPAGSRKVMKLVMSDLVEQVNARLAEGDERAVPYASTTVGDRLGVEAPRVRETLRALRKRGTIVKVDELPIPGRRDGTPLYALAVRGPCPLCASHVEARARVAGLDAEDAATARDRHRVVEPRDEQTEFTAVAVAELEDVVDAGLTAPEGGAGSLVGPTVRGHAAEQYAAEATARPCPFEVPFGPRPEPQRTKRRRERELRRA